MTKIRLIFKYAFKDLSRQRVRTILGIIGVMISVSLLSITLFLADSVSVAFADYLSVDAGQQDMVVSVRHYNGEPENRSTYFEYQSVIDTIEKTTDQIEHYIPRMEVWGVTNVSESYDTTNLTEYQEYTKISGINFSLEKEIGFGTFNKPDSDELLGLNQLPINHCAIYYEFNDEIKYSVGDTIEIGMRIVHGNMTIDRYQNLTIDRIFDYSLKWPSGYRNDNLIVVDIGTLYSIFGNETVDLTNRASKLITTFKTGANMYDVRDTEATEKRVKNLAAEVQYALGLEEYNIDLPKLEILGFSEILSMILTIIFVFVTIVAMLISGILINGILKTSVEERIREFGIFRTLGAYKSYNLWIVIVQGFLLCNFGTILGIVTSFFEAKYLIIPFAEKVILSNVAALGGASLEFSYTISSFIIAYCIGIGVGLTVSISPALKVAKLQLIESIHPYRHEDTLYHLQQKSTINYKLIIVGIILAANGGFIYFIIPRIIINFDLSLFGGALIVVLMIFLIGITLAGLGLMPLILKLMLTIFKPFSKKLHQVIRIFVFRYQRRNTSTIVIFALSFSFVIFTSSIVQALSSQVSMGQRLNYGSDLVFQTEGWNDENRNIDPTRLITTNFEDNLLSIDGVEKVSSVLATPSQLTNIYSKDNKEFRAEIGDYTGLITQQVRLLGIDQEYSSTVDSSIISLTRGSSMEIFDDLMDEEFSCIISEGLAEGLNLNVGDKIRIVIYRGAESEIYPFRIIGTASTMPGFSSEFGSYAGGTGGVLISQENYIELMDLPEPSWINKIFIKVKNDNYRTSLQIEEEIDELYENDYDFRTINLERNIRRQQSLFTVLDTFFFLILVGTVFICLFGLLSSSYSTIIERKKEIGIVRTLGLKGKDISRLFIIESLIIMLSSGTIGVIVGWACSWLVNSSLSLMTDSPFVPIFPWTNMIGIYVVSVLFLLIGMWLLLRKVKKKKIVDIYRETM
jgi:ABC-type antimicrobial peptide transport system permease subunit